MAAFTRPNLRDPTVLTTQPGLIRGAGQTAQVGIGGASPGGGDVTGPGVTGPSGVTPSTAQRAATVQGAGAAATRQTVATVNPIAGAPR